MLLAIDIGNTHTVFGLFKGKHLLSEWRISSANWKNGKVLLQTIRLLADEVGILPKDIEGVVISSVIPKNRDLLARVIKKSLHKTSFIISGEKKLGITINYQNPKTLGADRICNAAAAREKFGAPAIVIDCGTAITYDVISKKGEFIGGVIAAGIETSAAALVGRTAMLPNISFEVPNNIIGNSTVECMQSGIMYTTIEAINGIVKRIKKEIGNNAVVIATGGYAHIIAKHSSVIDRVEPSLVLGGARILYEMNNQRHQKKPSKNKTG